MNYKPITILLLTALSVALSSTAVANRTWYVNGITGSNTNNCMTVATACKTIRHAISLAAAGDSILVTPSTYRERLFIRFNLTIAGFGGRPVINPPCCNTVVTISSTTAKVTLSRITITGGATSGEVAGGGIINLGSLRLNAVHITGNSAWVGGGIYNPGNLVINNSTISENHAHSIEKVSEGIRIVVPGSGGGIANKGTLTLNTSTISGNTISGTTAGGGIYNSGTLVVNNSTISGNLLVNPPTRFISSGGGIYNSGHVTISSSTFASNAAQAGGNIFGCQVPDCGVSAPVVLKNSIIANSLSGGNCHGAIVSLGYNLGSDSTCKINSTGDMINTDPILGSLQHNGGPTQTMALPQGSPAVDAGSPSGCTDSLGHLLKTDQRGKPRPDAEDTAGCDIGAYEYQGSPLPVGHCVFVCGSTRCGMLTGYCVGSVNGACRQTYEPTQCPAGKPAGGFGSSCGQSIDTTRTCTP